MPKFLIEDTQTTRKFIFEGDSPPGESDIDSYLQPLFKEQPYLAKPIGEIRLRKPTETLLPIPEEELRKVRLKKELREVKEGKLKPTEWDIRYSRLGGYLQGILPVMGEEGRVARTLFPGATLAGGITGTVLTAGAISRLTAAIVPVAQTAIPMLSELYPTTMRILANSLHTTLIGLGVGALREAARQTGEEKVIPSRIAKEAGWSALKWAPWGIIGASTIGAGEPINFLTKWFSPRRAMAAAGVMGTSTLVTDLIRERKIDTNTLLDIGINSISAAILQGWRGVQIAEAYKNKEINNFIDNQLLARIKSRNPKLSDEEARALAVTLKIGIFNKPAIVRKIGSELEKAAEKTPISPAEPSVTIKTAIDYQNKISSLIREGKTAKAQALQIELDKILGIKTTPPEITPPVAPGVPITPTPVPILPEAEIEAPIPLEALKTRQEYEDDINKLNKQYQKAYKTGQTDKAADLWQDLKLLREDKNLHYPPEVKPTTLIGWIKKQGGINPQALVDYLGKDINWIKTNYPFFKTPGLLSSTGQKDLTEFYENAVTEGVILPLAEAEKETYTGGVGQYFLDQLKEGIGKKLEKVIETEEVPPVEEVVTPDILDDFEERIRNVQTIEELKDIAEELKMELDETNQGRIAQLFTLVDERQKQISIPKETKAEVQTVIPGAEAKMPEIGLQAPDLIQQPIGGLFAPPSEEAVPPKIEKIPTELEAENQAIVNLIEKAKKYKTAKEFFDAIDEEDSDLIQKYGYKSIEDFYEEAVKSKVKPEVNAEAVITNSDWLDNLPAQIETQWDNPDELYNLLKSVKEHELDFTDKSIFERFMEKIDARLTILSRETVKSEHIQKTNDAEQLQLYQDTNILGPEETKEVEAKKAKLKAKETIARSPLKTLLTKYEINEKEFDKWVEDQARAILRKETNNNTAIIDSSLAVFKQELAMYLLGLYDTFKSDKLGVEALNDLRNYAWKEGPRLARESIKMEKIPHVSKEAWKTLKENPAMTKEEFAEKFPTYRHKYDGMLAVILKQNTLSFNQQIHSKENSEESTLGEVIPDAKSVEPEFDMDNELYKQKADAALALLQKTLTPFELKTWQDYVTAKANGLRVGETPELSDILAKIMDIADSLSPVARRQFMKYTIGKLIHDEHRNLLDEKGETNLKILSMGYTDNLKRATDKLLDWMEKLGYDKKLLAKELYRSMELPADMAMKSKEFGPIFRLGQKIRTYERNELENIVYEDKMRYFEFENDKNFPEYKDIAMRLIFLGTEISTRNKNLTREQVKNLMLMELKKYPEIATTIFNIYYDGIRFIQEVVLAEKFRYAYQYYTPDKISKELFLEVLKHTQTFDSRFKKLYDDTKAMKFTAVEEVFAIIGNQQEMVNVYRQMIDSKIRFELDRIPFYFPIQRYGYWALSAVKPLATGEIPYENRHFARSDSKRELLAEKKRLQEEGYQIKFFGGIKELVKSNLGLIQDQISLFDFEELLRTVNLSPEEQQSEGIEAVRTYLMAKGFSRHWLHRTLAKGYKSDYRTGKKTFVYFADSAVTSYTNTKSRILLRQEIATIKDPAVKEFAQQWLRNLQNMSSTASNAMRLISTIWYLGGKVTFGTINLHQPLMTLYPLLEYHKPGSSERIMAKMGILMGSKKYYNMKAIKKSAEAGDELAQFLMQMAKQGILRGNLSNELMAAAFRGSKGITMVNSVANVTEHFNWKGGAIGGYLLGKELGLKGDELYDFVVKIDEQANFIYGPINYPLAIGRQKGLARTVVLSAYQFRHFWASFFSLIKDTSRGGPGKPPGWRGLRPDVFLRFLGILLWIGGLSALPFFNDINNLLRKWYGIDIKNEIYRRLPRFAARAIVRGAESAALGVDLSGLIGFGEVFNRGFWRGSLDLLDMAAFGGIIKKSTYAIELLREGETYRALENLSPRAISVLLRGARWIKEEGIREIGGKMIYPLKTVKEGIVGMLGFFPIGASEEYEKNTQIRELKRLHNDKVDDINRHFALGLYNGDEGRVERAIRMMEKWNQAHPEWPISLDNNAINTRLKGLQGITAEPVAIRPLIWELEDLYGED